jgi:hypothetical protein
VHGTTYNAVGDVSKSRGKSALIHTKRKVIYNFAEPQSFRVKLLVCRDVTCSRFIAHACGLLTSGQTDKTLNVRNNVVVILKCDRLVVAAKWRVQIN